MGEPSSSTDINMRSISKRGHSEDEADSSSSRKKRSTNNTDGGGGNNASGPTKDGWGDGITPATFKNILNSTIPIRGVIKNQYVREIDFSADINPRIINYQFLKWWLPQDGSTNNQSLQYFADNTSFSYMLHWTHAKFSIINDVALHQRIIPTDPATIEYIQDQQANLTIAYNQRVPYYATLSGAEASGSVTTGITSLAKSIPNLDIYKPTTIIQGIDQLPPKQQKTFNIDLHKLPHNKGWNIPTDLVTHVGGKYLLPQAHQVTSFTETTPATTYTILNSTEQLIETGGDDAVFGFTPTVQKYTIQKARALPAILLGQPELSGENNALKYKFKIIIQSELHWELKRAG